MAPQMSHSGRVRTTHPKPCEYFHPGEKVVVFSSEVWNKKRKKFKLALI